MTELTLTENERAAVIDGLINNCGNCGWREEDRGTLNSMSDRGLAMLAKQAQNTLVINGTKYDSRGARRTALDPGDVVMAPPTINFAAQPPRRSGPELLREGQAGSDQEMIAPTINWGAATGHPTDEHYDLDDEDDEDEEDEEMVPKETFSSNWAREQNEQWMMAKSRASNGG